MKRFVILVIFLALLITSSSISSNNVMLNDHSHVTWKKTYNTESELIAASDLVITGTVIGQYQEQRANLIFTKSIIQIDHIFKGSSAGSTIEVLQTGGSYNGITTKAIEGADLLQVNKVYQLALTLTEPDDIFGQYYLITGGFQGVSSISNQNTNGLQQPSFSIDSGYFSGEPSLSLYWGVDPTVYFHYFGNKSSTAVYMGFVSWNYSEFHFASTTSTSPDVGVYTYLYGQVGWYAMTDLDTNGTLIYGAEVDVNLSEATVLTSDQYQAILCHEAGHALGLNGHYVGGSATIMRQYAEDFMNSFNTPRTRDQNARNAIYSNLY